MDLIFIKYFYVIFEFFDDMFEVFDVIINFKIVWLISILIRKGFVAYKCMWQQKERDMCNAHD